MLEFVHFSTQCLWYTIVFQSSHIVYRIELSNYGISRYMHLLYGLYWEFRVVPCPLVVNYWLCGLVHMFNGLCGNLWTSYWIYGNNFVIVDSLNRITHRMDKNLRIWNFFGVIAINVWLCGLVHTLYGVLWEFVEFSHSLQQGNNVIVECLNMGTDRMDYGQRFCSPLHCLAEMMVSLDCGLYDKWHFICDFVKPIQM